MTGEASGLRNRGWRTWLYLILPIVVIFVVAAFLPPTWWAPVDADDVAAKNRAGDFEQKVTAAIHEIRSEPDPWGFRFTEQQANEWLATRLPAWIEHDQALDWPVGIRQVQVHLSGRSEVEIAAYSGAGLIWRARFEPIIDESSCRFRPISAGIGRLPIPGLGVEGLVALIPDGALEPDGTIAVPREFELVDGREVRLLGLELAKAEIGVVFETRKMMENAQD